MGETGLREIYVEKLAVELAPDARSFDQKSQSS
jgi:hypothetical protein